MRVSLSISCLAMLLGMASACGPKINSVQSIERDAGIECGSTDDEGESLECASGEVCLNHRCYAACSEDNECSLGQECSDGLCVTREPFDAGQDAGFDAGPPDPCDALTCEGARPLCREGVCVQCNSSADCGGATPICDVAFGTCVAFADVGMGWLCSPCTTPSDCSGMRTCADVDTRGAERVCLDACGDDSPCPTGFECDMATSTCRPTLNSCTAVRAMLTNRSCAADSDCVPIGAPVLPGACDIDPAMETGTCRIACGGSAGCPMGYACVEETFCAQSVSP